ncbi:unnamed protein product [Blepharisma stoltei]|uniref:RING-type E3 ubiquitin transferase n=1 Tax=Blepharisma stoltei TaxID=1481888 RepID=A0AAU9JJV5_9CILI|nr:unnamed protein product [Blepharisma stoltei]
MSVNASSIPKGDSIEKSKQLKERGNYYFSQQNYNDAISCYTQAIKLNSNDSIFYSNRARCYLNLFRYENALEDAQASIQLDSTNIKAHIIAVKSQANLAKFSYDMEKIEIALNQCRAAVLVAKIMGSKDFIKICKELKHKIKALKWCVSIEHHNQQVHELLNYYGRMPALESSLKKYVKYISTPEIPESLNCAITFDLFIDPVTNSTGHSYEREAIQAYMNAGRHYIDPISRQEALWNVLIPNKNMKDAVKYYVKTEFPWARISPTPIESSEINF